MNNTKKTILIDARTIEYSGIGRYLVNLLSNFELNDSFNFELLLNKPEPKFANLKQHITDILPYSLAEQTKLANTIESLKPDLVHFAHFSRPWRKLSMPAVTTIHDLTLLDYPAKDGFSLSSMLKRKSLKFGLKSILRSDVAIITPSHFVGRQIAKLRPEADSKITTTHLGFDKTAHAKAAKPKRKLPKRFFLYVGNAFAHKNLEILVVALDLDKTLQIVTVGDPKSGYDKFQHPRLHKLGRLSDGELAYLYKNAQALIFPSKSEGFGLPGLEAMAYGCPVISSSASCLPEIYGDAALYFNPDSADQLMDQISRLEARRADLIKLGGARATEFSWQKTAKETLEVYGSALEKD